MHRSAVVGPGAERDAARLLYEARREGVVAHGARLTAAADAALPEADRAFVAAHGALWPNEAFWLEWGSGRTLRAEPPEAADLLVIACPDPAALPPGFASERRAAAPLPADRGAAIRIGLLGGTDRPTTYPASVARLGDAADRLGIPVEPVFLPPDDLPADLAGIVLPGGSALATVPAQCAAALAAIERELPVLGLCLGMQSMATALIRTAWPEATLEEIVGPGPCRSFVLLQDASGPRHRLGEAHFDPAPATRLAALLPEGATIRLNHRYALAPDAPVPHAVIHRDTNGIADAIELSGHPFFIGLQGHPEFGCDPALAALWDGFLAAALHHSR
ncbi:MAG: glutamine amidotransferase-related protein [Acidiphilium sp.]